jgi:hypothetical protein
MKNGSRFAAATFFREPLAKKKDSKETSSLFIALSL